MADESVPPPAAPPAGTSLDLEPKVWWKKQRAWAMVLGILGTVASFIPPVAVVAGPVLAVAGLLGFKGVVDAQDRTENLMKAEVKATLAAKEPC